jgi:hypothetical protein
MRLGKLHAFGTVAQRVTRTRIIDSYRELPRVLFQRPLNPPGRSNGNAFCASENLDAFIALRSSRPGNRRE